MPTAKMSARASTSRPCAASGDRYENLPFTTPGSVSSTWLAALARPKSTSFTSPIFEMRMLGGEMSRWTMPSEPGLGIDHVMRVGQAFADLHHEVDGLGGAHTPALPFERLQDRLQVRAVDKLHDDEVSPVGDADVEDLDDVGMLQVKREPGLVEEHGEELFVLREVGQDAFDGDVFLEAFDRLGDSPIDFRHPAGI